MNNFWLNKMAQKMSFGQLAEWDSSIEETTNDFEDFIFVCKSCYSWAFEVK